MGKFCVKHKVIHLLALSMVVCCAIILMPSHEAYAGTNRHTEYNNNGGTQWSYGQNLAGADITEKGTGISNTVTVYLTDEQRKAADHGALSYVASTHIGANGSRTVKPHIKVKCYDKNGMEFNEGRYERSDSTYWVSHANYDYKSDRVIIPAYTSKIVYEVGVSINMSGSLELEDMSFVINYSPDVDEVTYTPIGPVEDINLCESYEVVNGVEKGTSPEVRYYDIYKDIEHRRVSTANSELIFRDAILNQGELNKWSQLAYKIYRGDKHTYWPNEPENYDKNFGEGFYCDLVNDLQRYMPKQEKADNVVVQSSGLQMTDSFENAIIAMHRQQAELRNRNATVNTFYNEHKDNITLGSDAEDNKNQLVYYTVMTSNDAYGGTYQYGYNTMGLVFYDFSVEPLVDKEPYYTEPINDSYLDELITNKDVSYSTNDTTEPMSVSQSSTYTVETDTTNTITTTNAVEIGHATGFEVGVSDKFDAGSTELTVDVSIGYDYNYSELCQFEDSNSSSVSKSLSNEVGMNANLPAHTQLEIENIVEQQAANLKYDCPVGISYKVAVVSMCGHYYDDNAAILDMNGYSHYSFITVFGNDETQSARKKNAAKNLYQRAYNPSSETVYGYTKLYKCGDKVPLQSNLWLNSVMATTEPARSPNTDFHPTLYTGDELVKELTKNEPMAATGAQIATDARTTSTQATGLDPLYPLTKINVIDIENNDGVKQYITVPKGGSYYLSNITIDGFDKDSAHYHGFDADYGSWELIDEETGEPLDKDIAEIKTSKSSGAEKLYVYKAYDGIQLKYVIEEDKYKAAGQENYTRNEDLKKTAYVDVKVDGTEIKEPSYTDVQVGDWFAEDVNYMTTLGYMNGVGEEQFAPNAMATRAMAINVLWNIDKQPEPKNVATFIDLTQDWYKKAVSWGVENNITKGTGNNKFSPDQNITREQLVTMIYQYFLKNDENNLKNYISVSKDSEITVDQIVRKVDYAELGGDLSKFVDSKDVSKYATEAFEWAVSEGLVVGDDKGALNPKATATRAEISALLARFSA